MVEFVGKKVAFRVYVHREFLATWHEDVISVIKVALDESRIADDAFNVIRFEEGKSVAFLRYDKFFEDAFPRLQESWSFDFKNRKTSYRDYRKSLNVPILHRKERLISTSHKDYVVFSSLTKQLEEIGAFKESTKIGFSLFWENLLDNLGYKVVGHDLHIIGNNEESDVTDFLAPAIKADYVIPRHLTALQRSTMSAPVSAMLRVGLIAPNKEFFDYGCGHGTDIISLKNLGIKTSGWDPYYSPENSLTKAEVINLGFVINVIENLEERKEALRNAFSLAKEVLCVSVMLENDNRSGIEFLDGVVTKRGTFQKYYSSSEIKAYIEGVLGRSSMTLAPGIYLVFADLKVEAVYLGNRKGMRRERLSVSPKHVAQHMPREFVVSKTQLKKEAQEIERQKVNNLRQDFIELWLDLGREPFYDEVPEVEKYIEVFGSFNRIVARSREGLSLDLLASRRKEKIEDILVLLAMENFTKKSRFMDFPISVQRDIRIFFNDLNSARKQAYSLLLLAGNCDTLKEACREGQEQGFGSLSDGDVLTVHASLVPYLPAVLRTYAGCASVLYGSLELVDLIEFWPDDGKICIYNFSDFSESMPSFKQKVTVRLKRNQVSVYSFSDSHNVLPYKSRFMNPVMEGFNEQVEFEKKLSRFISFDENSFLIKREQIDLVLARHCYKIAPNGLGLEKFEPELSEKCSKHFRFEDLILAGETVFDSKISNRPKQIESYNALRDLSLLVLDPVVDWFGSLKVTYGFCSFELSKMIKKRIAPKLDQHCSYELNSKRNFICERVGAAVDFIVEDEDMFEVAKWVFNNTPVDRLYFYGHDRPIHVSYAPENKKVAFLMKDIGDGRKIPVELKFD